MQSENTAETETAPEGDAGESANMATLTELLAEPEIVNETTMSEGENENGADAGNGEKNTKPVMFNDLAESLGIELDDLYALKVSTANGESVSIQDLKALQTTQDDIVVRELEFEETRASKEDQLRQAQNEISEIVAALPEGTIKPALLEKMRAKTAANVELEQSRTLAFIPAWRDEATRTKDMQGMTAHLERFGFPANHLAKVVDHRMYIFIRESFLREQRIKNALARVKVGKPNPTTATKTAGKSPVKTGGRPKNQNTRNGLESFFSEVE